MAKEAEYHDIKPGAVLVYEWYDGVIRFVKILKVHEYAQGCAETLVDLTDGVQLRRFVPVSFVMGPPDGQNRSCMVLDQDELLRVCNAVNAVGNSLRHISNMIAGVAKEVEELEVVNIRGDRNV